MSEAIFNDEKLRFLFGKMGRTYQPDQVVFLENDRGIEMFVIVSGEVEITKTYKEIELFSNSQLTLGSTVETLAVLGPGDFFGEMALLNEEPRMATARARTQVEVIVLGKGDLETLMLKSPMLAIQMMKSVCERLRRAENSPNVDSVLPKIQEQISAMQRGRSRKGITESPAEPASAPRRAYVAAKPLEIGEKVEESRKCGSCGRVSRIDDRFCGSCGRAIA